MSKRNTVRINMDLLDGYLTVKNITPKEFCETRLGFTDGWYYGIRKNGGRGVKVLVAQLIARSIGVEYETLVIPEEDTGSKTAAGASPRPTETKDMQIHAHGYLVNTVLDTAELLTETQKELDALKMENHILKKDLEEKEKALAVAFEQIEALGRKAEDGVIPVHINDFIHILETALSNQIVKNEMNNDKLFGYVDCFITLRYLANKRKEKAKNARPEED